LPKIITAGILSSCHSGRSEESRIWSFCARFGSIIMASNALEGDIEQEKTFGKEYNFHFLLFLGITPITAVLNPFP
jgi:hypothetical protein